MTDDPEQTIARAHAELKFYQARVAILEAASAYRRLEEEHVGPEPGVTARLAALTAAYRGLDAAPPADPCPHCGERPPE